MWCFVSQSDSINKYIFLYIENTIRMCVCVCVCVHVYSNIEGIQNGWRALIPERWMDLDLCIDYASCSPIRSYCFEANQVKTL